MIIYHNNDDANTSIKASNTMEKFYLIPCFAISLCYYYTRKSPEIVDF